MLKPREFRNKLSGLFLTPFLIKPGALYKTSEFYNIHAVRIFNFLSKFGFQFQICKKMILREATE